jgi:hypothetical protein
MLYPFPSPVILSHISGSCPQSFTSNFDAVMVFSGTDLHRWIPDSHTSLAVFLPTAARLFSFFAHSEYLSASTYWLFTLVSDIALNMHYFYFAYRCLSKSLTTLPFTASSASSVFASLNPRILAPTCHQT